MTRGFFVGRFQPYHDGHHEVVRQIAAEVDELVVGIGSAGESHAPSNPFTGGERVEMLTRALAPFDIPTYVVPIEDIERHAVWVSHVRSMCPPFEVAYSNNPLVIQLFREAGVEVRRQPMHRRATLEGTEIRERMRAGDSWREVVPDPVASVIGEIDGVERLRQVSASDANGSDGVGGDTDGSGRTDG